MQTARDGRPDVARPNLVMAADRRTRPSARRAHYFGVELRVVPVGADFRADPAAMAAAIDDSTVLVVASAPSYAHGVVDPVPEIAAAAAARGVRCHVDACIGGWVLPYAARLGRPCPRGRSRSTGSPRSRSTPTSTPTPPRGPRSCCTGPRQLRRPQFFASADWPGYTMLNTTMQSTKSGGPLAGAWAVRADARRRGLPRAGRADVRRGRPDRGAASRRSRACGLAVPPDSTLVTLVTDDTCDAFTVCDEMVTRGWYVQPQLSYAGAPPTIHLSVSAATLAHVDELAGALAASVAAAVAAGPVLVDPGVVAFIAALDPAALSDEDFDGLLAASGLVGESADGGLALPTRMAEVNAMLDLASPAMREALLVAFLDRLSRPVR